MAEVMLVECYGNVHKIDFSHVLPPEEREKRLKWVHQFCVNSIMELSEEKREEFFAKQREKYGDDYEPWVKAGDESD